MSKFALIGAISGVGAAGAMTAAVMTGAIDMDALMGRAPDPAAQSVPAEAPAEPEDKPVAALAEPEPEAAPPGPEAPVFTLVRAETDGLTLVAGRAAPGSTVTVQVDGAEAARTQAGGDGQFAAFLDLPPSAEPRILTLVMEIAGAQVASEGEVILAPVPVVAEAPPEVAEDVAALEAGQRQDPAPPRPERLADPAPTAADPAGPPVAEAVPGDSSDLDTASADRPLAAQETDDPQAPAVQDAPQVADRSGDGEIATAAAPSRADGPERLAVAEAQTESAARPEAELALVDPVAPGDAEAAPDVAAAGAGDARIALGDPARAADPALPSETDPDTASAARPDPGTDVPIPNGPAPGNSPSLAALAEGGVPVARRSEALPDAVAPGASAAVDARPADLPQIAGVAPDPVDPVAPAEAPALAETRAQDGSVRRGDALALATQGPAPQAARADTGLPAKPRIDAADLGARGLDADGPAPAEAVGPGADEPSPGTGAVMRVAEPAPAEAAPDPVEPGPDLLAAAPDAPAPGAEAAAPRLAGTALQDQAVPARGTDPARPEAEPVVAALAADTGPTPAPVLDAADPVRPGAPGAADGPAMALASADPSLSARRDTLARAADAPPAETLPPAVLLNAPQGVEVLQTAPLAPGEVALDSISYDAAGEVLLSGRGEDTAYVRIYLDNAPVTTSRIREDGRWRVELPQVDTGTYTLRVDQLDAGGSVISRVESPFLREDPALLEAYARGEGPIKTVIVQPGNTLWGISRERYGRGMAYVEVFEANRDRIRNPDLIYPGQIFDLPEDAVVATE